MYELIIDIAIVYWFSRNEPLSTDLNGRCQEKKVRKAPAHTFDLSCLSVDSELFY